MISDMSCLCLFCYIVEQLKKSSILFYPICPMVQQRMSDADCFYFTKVSHILSSHNMTWPSSRIRALTSSARKISQTLVLNVGSVAVDLYSIDELTTGKLGEQWRCANRVKRSSQLTHVEKMFIVTGQHLHERHRNLKNVFQYHSIDHRSLEWRWRWNQTRCHSTNSQQEIIEKMNLAGRKYFQREQL